MKALTHTCVLITTAILAIGVISAPDMMPQFSIAQVPDASTEIAEHAIGDYRLEDDLRGAGLRAGAIVSVRKEASHYVIQGVAPAHKSAPLRVAFQFGADGQATQLVLSQGAASAQALRIGGAS